jgi:hypothetical protein
MLYREGDRFSQGMCRFSRSLSTRQGELDRIALFIDIEGSQTEAAVDTGGAYLLCNPEIARELQLDPAEGLPIDHLYVRGQRIPGTLHKVSLTLLAEEGESLWVDVTAFVPRSGPSIEWDLPVMLGFTGCLERCRFAVDPETETFYFGAFGY